jgi:hypothetical protein
MKTLPSDPFLSAYLTAALWTTDPCPGSGEYYASPDMLSRIPDDFIKQAETDCRDFQEANADLLASAGDDSQNGHDFWLTRNRHGAGFWDHGYGETGRKLTDAAHVYGEHYLELGGWWVVSYRCKCGEEWTRPEDSDNDPAFGEDTCDGCGMKCESLNRQQGENLVPCDEPEA